MRGTLAVKGLTSDSIVLKYFFKEVVVSHITSFEIFRLREESITHSLKKVL